MAEQEQNKEQNLDLTKLEVNSLPQLQGWEDKQNALVEENPYIEIIDKETYEEAKKRRTALLKGRTELQNQDKTVASLLTKFRKKVKETTENLIGITQAAEDKQQDEVKRWEKILEDEREAKRIEEERKQKEIEQSVENFKNEITEFVNSTTLEQAQQRDAQINALEVKIGGFVSDNDLGDYAFLIDDSIERFKNDLNTKIDALLKDEELRVSRIKQERFEELEQVQERAQKVLDETNVENMEFAGQAVTKAVTVPNAIQFFGDMFGKYNAICERYEKMVGDKVKSLENEKEAYLQRQKEAQEQKEREKRLNDLEAIHKVKTVVYDEIKSLDVENFKVLSPKIAKAINRELGEFVDAGIKEAIDASESLHEELVKVLGDLKEKREELDQIEEEKREREQKELLDRVEHRKKTLEEYGYTRAANGYCFKDSEAMISDNYLTAPQDEWVEVWETLEEQRKDYLEQLDQDKEREERLAEDKGKLREVFIDLNARNEHKDYPDFENQEVKGFSQMFFNELDAFTTRWETKLKNL